MSNADEMSNPKNDNEKVDVLQAVRNDFFEINKEKIANNELDERDLNRLKENDEWLSAFYTKCEKKTDETLKYMLEVLLWRKSFGANDLLSLEKEEFFQKILSKGGYFTKNADKNGVPILNVRACAFGKTEFPYDQVTKFIAYHFEKSYKFNSDHQLVCLFDLYKSGLANYDLEVMRFMVNCLKIYYPLLTAYVVVFDAPFVFQAFWKILKLLLNQEIRDKVKFVDKRSIREFFDESQIPPHMGGTDGIENQSK